MCASAEAEPLDPIANRARLLYQDIYDLASRAVLLPYELARPVVVRVALEAWVRKLPLDDAVESRVLERIDSPALLDEVVPFLLELKETYVAGGDAVESFDAFLRRTYSPADRIPGMEHSMFAWADEAAPIPGGPGFALDPRRTPSSASGVRR
jgi:hypothetical protein